MITSLEISGLRGIREGKLEDLTPLVILVGPNGCGKSTLLDALLIGASETPQAGVQLVRSRHTGLQNDARWLLWRGGQEAKAIVAMRQEGLGPRVCELEVIAQAKDIRCHVRPTDHTTSTPARPARKTSPLAPAPAQESPRRVRLLDSLSEKEAHPLHQLVTLAYKRGLRREVAEQVAEIVPRMREVLILTDGNTPVVHLEFDDHTVPVSLAGDGIHALVRICLELVCSDAGLVLIEEPEVHQHPAAIRQSVRAILNGVRRGTQIVLTTHSLELIDAFLAESSEKDLESLSLYRLGLADGRLVAVRSSGTEVAFARGDVQRDLR